MALADFLNGAGKSIQQLLLERQLEAMGVSPAQILQRNQNRQDAELQMKQQEFQQNQQRLNTANDLKLGDSSGGVALWIGPGTEGYFSGLKIQAAK